MGRSLALSAVLLACLASDAAAADLTGTPFASCPNNVAIAELERGRVVRRSSAAGTLTDDDRQRLGTLGMGTAAAVVVLHRIPRVDDGRQAARLRALARSLDGFNPSGACDAIVSEGDYKALCLGSVDGPLGRVSARMPVASTLTQDARGGFRLLIRNQRDLEIKPLFSWSSVVPAGRLNVVYDLVPADDAWLVSTYISVEMSAHKGSASKISDAMVKLETWLTGELARVARQQRPAEEPGLPKKGAVAAANRGSGVVSTE
jgi:hypothetical protein